MQKKDKCDECRQCSQTKIKGFKKFESDNCSNCLKAKNKSKTKIESDNKSNNIKQNQINNENFKMKNKYSSQQLSQKVKFDHQNLLKVNNTYIECPQHKKNIQLICLEDKQLLCSHCAIFGGHRQHNLKTIECFESQLKQRILSINQITVLKQQTDLKLKGKQFLGGISQELNKRKDFLVKQIREKYKLIYQRIKQSQQKVYSQLIKAFKQINHQIQKMNKDKTQFQKSYKIWLLQCQQFIKKFQNLTTIPQKVKVFYQESLDNLSVGRKLVRKIQDKNNNMKQKIIDYINGIGLQISGNLQSFIYNHIHIKTNLPFSLSKTYSSQSSLPKSMSNSRVSEISKELVEEKHPQKQKLKQKSKSILNPMNTQFSPKFHKTLSKKFNHYPHKNLPSSMKVVKKDDGLQVKHLQNLAFAERMLTQFKNSKDTLDMTGCNLSNQEIYCVVMAASQTKNINHLKVAQNQLTNNGLVQIFRFLNTSKSLNLAYNQLTEQILDQFFNFRQVMPHLRIINLTQNRIISEKKSKNKIQKLKKLGVVVTI